MSENFSLACNTLDGIVNNIYCGDCLALFRIIPEDNLNLSEYLSWCEKWINEMVRVVKPTGSIIIHNIPKWLTYYSCYLNNIAYFKHWIAWDAPTSATNKLLQPSHYGMLFYTKQPSGGKFYKVRYPHPRDRSGRMIKDYGGRKNKLHPFGPLASDIWTDIHRIKHSKYRDQHPCQLPLPLLDRIILMTTDENDIVLDPFLGTGTTAISAKQLGRRFIGFEIDENYLNIAKSKLEKVTPNSKIGDCWVSFHLGNIATIRDQDWNVLSKYFYIPSEPSIIEKESIKMRKE